MTPVNGHQATATPNNRQESDEAFAEHANKLAQAVLTSPWLPRWDRPLDEVGVWD